MTHTPLGSDRRGRLNRAALLLRHARVRKATDVPLRGSYMSAQPRASANHARN